MMTKEEFIKTHRVGFLKIPRFDALTAKAACIAPIGVRYPGVIDNRDQTTITEDQGNKPCCAACACSSFGEQLIWRRDGIVYQLDYDKVYARAKELDGDNEDGATLTHAMRALFDVYPDHFNPSIRLYTIQKIPGYTDELKRFVHKYGSLPIGLNITEAWYDSYGDNKGYIKSGGAHIGGHAVLCVGYNHNGVIIQNSWGYKGWGDYGYAVLSWADFSKQFVYGVAPINCLNDFN